MSVVALWLLSLPAMLGLALIAWIVATVRRNVGLVDIAWSLFVLLGALVMAIASPESGTRASLALGLVACWALRLAAHLAVRNWRAPEDRRYRVIRARHQPGFEWKSLFLVFALQAVLAWLIAAPIAAAQGLASPVVALDLLGAVLVILGIAFEAVADAELARFNADPANAGAVMDRGLWRYTRHPNYFGEFCVWWGLWVIALAAGAWWTVFSPILISVLLLRVSGVTLLEKNIAERRPGYREYVRRTNAFFPGPPRSA